MILGSTFIITPAIDGDTTNYVSFKSSMYPGRVIRHTNNKLYIDPLLWFNHGLANKDDALFQIQCLDSSNCPTNDAWFPLYDSSGSLLSKTIPFIQWNFMDKWMTILLLIMVVFTFGNIMYCRNNIKKINGQAYNIKVSEI